MAVDDLLIEVMDEMSRLRTWCDAVGGDGEQEQHDGQLEKYRILIFFKMQEQQDGHLENAK